MLVLLKNKQSALFLVKSNKSAVGEDLYKHRIFNLIITLQNSNTNILDNNSNILVSGYRKKGSLKLRNTSYLPHSVTYRRISEICILSSTHIYGYETIYIISSEQ